VHVRRITPLCLGSLVVIGCGSAPAIDASDEMDSGAFVQVDPEVNAGPVFDRALIIPFDISPTASAAIAVKASDPDGTDTSLVYRWTAASGTFSKPDRPTTAYSCGNLGPQVLQVSAQDGHGYIGYLALKVNCIP
jgi:hypothetical protein